VFKIDFAGVLQKGICPSCFARDGLGKFFTGA